MDSSKLLSSIPDSLRMPLFEAFNEICNNYSLRHYEPSALNGGKFCEIVYTILKGVIDKHFPDKPQKPRNMFVACNQLEQADPNTINRSIRILIPRVLLAIYEIRNNRGIGHAGGDVDPNHQDSFYVVNSAKWILSELIRIFHNLSIEEAESYIDKLISFDIPIIWSVDGKKRILNLGLKTEDKVLILIYDSVLGVKDNVLIDWLEYSNSSRFKNEILGNMHKEKKIEYNKNTKIVIISPLGKIYVENNLIKYFSVVRN